MTQDTEDVVALIERLRRSHGAGDLQIEAADRLQSLSDRIDVLEGRGEAVTDEELLEDFARALCAHNFRKHGCEGQFGTVDDCWFAFADEAQAAARAALHQEGIAP